MHHYVKANNIYMKDYDKNKQSSYLKYWNVNNSYGWVMSQKSPVNKFEWIEETFQFNEYFIMNTHKKFKANMKSWVIFENVHRVIKFNQKDRLRSYVDMNTELKQKAKNNFEKDFVKLMNNAVFGKTMEIVIKHKHIKLVTTKRKRNYLLSQANNHTTKFFMENILAMKMRKTQIIMNKPVYLGLSILDLSKTVM